MNYKYRLESINQKDQTVIKQYKTLKEIAEELNIELHLIRKINQLTEKRCKSVKPHIRHHEIYEKIKIYNIIKEYNI
jgi:hypothetical protein